MGAEMPKVSSHCRASILAMLALTLVGLTDGGVASAQEAACSVSGTEQRPVGLGDYGCIRKPTAARVSNDGKRIAFVDGSTIQVRSVDGAEPWSPKIPDEEGGASPIWSSNDEALYFLSPDSDETTLWRVPTTGSGKPQEIGSIEGKVDAINLSPDQSRLLVTRNCPPKTAPDEAAPACPDATRPIVITGVAFKKDRKGFSVAERPDRIYAFDIATGRLSQLTGDAQDRYAGGSSTDSEPAWSPDGKQVAFIREYPSRLEFVSELWIAPSDPMGRGIASRLTDTPAAGSDARNAAERRSPSWSRDGKLIAYLRKEERYGPYALAQLAVYSLVDRKETVLSEKLDRAVTAFGFSRDGRFIYFTYANEGGRTLARVRLQDGSIEDLVTGENNITALDIGGDDRLALVMEQGNDAPKLYSYHLGESPKEVADLNADYMKGLIVAPREKIDIPVYGGDHFEAFITKPTNYEPGRRYPTLVYIHGGPVDDFRYGFKFDSQFYAAHGYLVIEPNPPGSLGRGQKDVLQIKGNWGCTNYPDILLAVDQAIALGFADPKRLAVGGYSYGGYLTNCILTRVPDKFQAAVSGAGHSFVAANYGHDIWLKWYRWELGAPWKKANRELYNRLSPLNDAERVKTPTLFLSGDADWNVPLINSELFYEALREQGVESRLVVYPGAAHVAGWGKKYNDSYYQEILNWLNKHIGQPM